MNVKHRNIIRFVVILFVLSVVCLLFTFYYWSVAVIPLLSENPNGPERLFAHKIHHEHHHHRSIQSQGNEAAAAGHYEDLSKGKTSFEDDWEMSQARDEVARRKELVKSLCKQFHLGKYKWSNNNSNDLNLKEPPTPLYSYFFWNREKRLAWCPVYKAGSTSWLKNMLRLIFDEKTVENPPKQLSIWAREVYGDLDNFNGEEWEKSLKLLVVRHPFERLLSAYRDKLANSSYGHEHGTHHFYLKYGKRIVQKYRTDSKISQIEPTWEEFVRYILKTDLIQYADDHWLPAYYSCTPCLIDYDIIAKTESYFRDQKFIIKESNLDKILKPRWSHSTWNNNNDSKSRIQLAKQFFSQLTKSQVEQLYKKYKLDFLLFGYSHEQYVQFARD